MKQTNSQILEEELNTFLKDVKYNLNANHKNASGRTADSFSFRVKNQNEAYVFGPAYADTLQKGRGPGKFPKGFPQILKDWAKAKGLSFNTQEDLDRFAWALANRIKQSGTAQFRSRTYYDIYDSAFEDCMDRVTDRLGDKYLDSLISNF